MNIFKLVALGCLSYLAEGCKTFCSRNYRPVCGFDGTCYTEARNACFMKNVNCLRVAKEEKVFKNVRHGICQQTLPICKLLPDDESKP
ncbi:uncharacterized protein LOC108102469 [Drosophila eugracilis]|uniref:uncharacterized protein LOC108102469 n=1 Tax=Drosophila eugracilis TaxID=29029 RepID=UPI0007E6F55D|nr:uncharacterized protein LOC108102469 [Drosophila eugracilis]